MKKIFSKDNKGFTLVELIIVIAVLAIITVVAAPFFLEYVEKSRVGTDRNAIGEVAHAAEVVYVQLDKKDTATLKVRIDSKGNAKYGGDAIGTEFASQVKEIVPPESYIYKSKTYRNNTVTITVTDGVATIGEMTGNGLTGALGELVNGIVDGFNLIPGVNIDKDKVNETISDLLFDIETEVGSWEEMTDEEKANAQEKIEEAIKDEFVGSISTCTSCLGIGTKTTVHTCDDCSGTGLKDCPDCDWKTYYKKCKTCGWQRTITCSHPNNNGKAVYTVTGTCTTCNGTGQQKK